MWTTIALTCRAVILAVLCGSVVSVGAERLRFQAIEPHRAARLVAGQLFPEVIGFAGYVAFTVPNSLAPGLGGPSSLTSSTTQVYCDDRAGGLGSLAAILRGPGESLALPAALSPLSDGDSLTLDSHVDFWGAVASGNSGVAAHAGNPGAYLLIGFSREPGFDGLLMALHTGVEDPTAGVRTLRGGVQGRQLVDAAGGLTSEGFVHRAPVPGAALLALFGLGAVGLSWRRFA